MSRRSSGRRQLGLFRKFQYKLMHLLAFLSSPKPDHVPELLNVSSDHGHTGDCIISSRNRTLSLPQVALVWKRPSISCN